MKIAKWWRFALVAALALLAGCGQGLEQGQQRLQPLLAATPDHTEVVQHLYVSYYGRPADPAGLAFWADYLAQGQAPTTLGAFVTAYASHPAVKTVVDNFGRSEESVALYGTDPEVIVRAIYRNLFNREPDAEGLLFYVEGLNKGWISNAQAALSIANGARGSDALSIASKVETAVGFTSALSPAQTARYSGLSANTAVRTALQAVGPTSDVASGISGLRVALGPVFGSSFESALIRSPLPDYQTKDHSAAQVVAGLVRMPYASSFIRGADGNLRVITFPTMFNEPPVDMPALILTEGPPNEFRLERVVEGLSMGGARDSAWINAGSPPSRQLVIVDQGAEYPDYPNWSFGSVVIASDSGSGFEFRTVSTVRAFNHSVTVTDLNSDGRDDIVALNMGIKGFPNNERTPLRSVLHAYLQDAAGSFQQRTDLIPEASPYNEDGTEDWARASGGAVAAADLDGDGVAELILGNYLASPLFPPWGGLKLFTRDAEGVFRGRTVTPKEGNFTTMGAHQIEVLDVDGDGDLDILVVLEGQYPGAASNVWNGLGLELYLNHGALEFTRATETFFPDHRFIWNTYPVPAAARELFFTGVKVVDLDGDGRLDIFLQYGGGSVYPRSPRVDLGAWILRNVQGERFEWLTGVDGLTVDFGQSDRLLNSFRYMDQAGATHRIFGFDTRGVPTVITLRPR